MKTKVYNLEGKETGELNLDEKVFGVKVKPEVVHEVFVAMTNNQREPWADTKNRGEVSGGGRKPWKQKGTGRARHGSIRSPIWVGGGVAFGPLTERTYKTKINKKTRRLATRMCLSDKLASGLLTVVENFDFSDLKTKAFAAFLSKLPTKHKSYLILTGTSDKDKVYRMARNLKKMEIMRAADANVMVLAQKEAVIVSREGAAEIEKILIKND
jgi:large subunit ribosomal protein L4